MDLDDLEIALVPFNTVVALKSCATAIQYDASGRLTGPCDGLDKHVMNFQSSFLADASPDSVLYRMWSLWRKQQGGWDSLVDLLEDVVDRLLEIPGGRPACRGDVAPEVWMRFQHRFDPALSLCVFAATRGVDGDELQPDHFAVNYHDVEFREVLDHSDGLAETHVHVNAALTTECLWCLSVSGDSTYAPDPSKFRAETPEEGGPGDAPLTSWLIVAAITRSLLFQHLSHEERAGDFSFLAAEELEDAAGVVLRSRHDAEMMAKVWTASLHGSSIGVYQVPEDDWRTVQEELQVRAPPNSAPSRLDSQGLGALVWAERRMIADVLGQIFQARATGRRVPDLEGAFLQYVRVRNLLHRFVVYSPRKGRFEFSRRFGRASRYLKRFYESHEDALQFGLEQLDPYRQVRLWELRYSARTEDKSGVDQLMPLDSLRWILTSIEKVEGGDPARPRRAGIIFHFLKPNPLAEVAPPMLPSTRARLRGQWRYEEVFHSHLEEAAMLFHLWQSLPEMAPWFCGFDVAGYERFEEAAPTWIYLAICRKLRERCKKAAYQRSMPSPKFTWHAGEVFSHVATGLRRVDEVVTFLEAGALERIGHALALAQDRPQRGNEPVSNEEWGRTLLWARSMFATDEDEYQSASLEHRVEDWVDELNGRIGSWAAACRVPVQMPHLTAGMLHNAFENLGNPRSLSKLGYPFDHLEKAYDRASDDAERLVVFLLSNKGYHEWAVTQQRQDDLSQGDLDKLRRLVIDRAAKHPVAIEACPTSNITIGDLPRYYHSHPALHRYSQGGELAPRVSLNTDDPIQFATNLRTEYWLMFKAKASHTSPKVAAGWLSDRREDGVMSSFLHDRPASPEDWSKLRSAWDRLADKLAIELPSTEQFWRYPA